MTPAEERGADRSTTPPAVRVEVDASGIRIRHTEGVERYSWHEVANVTLQVHLPPTSNRCVLLMDIENVSGDERLLIYEDIEGFHEAVKAVVAHSGNAVPDLTALQPSDGLVELYRPAL